MGARSRPPVRRSIRRPVRRSGGLRPRSRSALYQQRKQEAVARNERDQLREQERYAAAKAEAPAAEQQVAAAQEQIATQGAKREPFEGLINEIAPTPTPADSGSSFGPYPTQPQDTRSPQVLPGINRMAGGQNLPQTLPALNRSIAGRFGTGGTGLTPAAMEDLLARAEANAQTAPQKRTASRRPVSRRRVGRQSYTPRLKRRSMFSSRRRRF